MAFGALISGDMIFSHIRYSRLIAIADGHSWSKKTYNNAISVLRRAFDFGYRDRPVHENPALNVRCARLRKADRPKVDPFAMHDAERFIAAEFPVSTGIKPKPAKIAAFSCVLARDPC